MTKALPVGVGAATVVIAALIAFAFVPMTASADSNAVNFESPYTLGTINGQDGWSSLGAAGSGCAIYDHAVASNTYGFGTFGAQVLRISNAVTSGCFGDQTFSKSLVNEAGEASSTNSGMSGGTRQPHFEAQFDFASTMSTQQPGLFMSVSPDRGDGSRMSYLGFSDEATGIDVIFYDTPGTTNPASFVATTVASGLSRATTHTAKFVIDFVNGPSNDVVKIYIDGVLVHTGTTWENYFRYDAEASAEQSPRTVDNLIFRTGGSAASGTAGNGFLVDNLSQLSGPTPTGSIEITKYACPDSTVVTRSANGVGQTVPAGCALQTGATFGYVHGTQTDANAPYPELSTPLTAGGATNGSGVLTIASLPADGRYLVVETDSSNQQLPAGDILGLYCEGDGDTSGNNDNQELTFVAANALVKCIAYNKAVAPSTVTVTINKFIDGVQATAGSANSSAFPMSATWNAANIGAGTGAYALDADGFNGNPTPYQAITSPMNSGADYSTYEVTGGAVVGASCADGKPYALVGYKVGDDLVAAQAAPTSTTTPNFTNLTSNKVVLVLNTICVPTPVHISPANGSTLTSAALTSIDWTDVTDPAMPMTYRYQSSHSSATNSDGSFTTPVYTSGVLAVSQIGTAGTPEGVYYWHVRAVDNDGNMSPWTTAWQVTVDNTPNPPVNACATPSVAPAGYTLQNGTAGHDKVTLAPQTMFVGLGGNDKVNAGSGNYIICLGAGNDTIITGSGDVTIDAGLGNNKITTGDGAGTIVVGAGDDKITVGTGTHTITAGNGNNTIQTGNGDQTITVGGGNDKITTGSGNDTITAGEGNNKVNTNAGNDTITAGAGNDKIDGGPGASDTCNAGAGFNTVLNCEL